MQTTKLLTFLDELEAVGAEIASKLAPWLAPLLSAVVVGRAVTAAPFNWPWWLAWLTGAAIELSGIATLNTALMLWSYRAEQPDDKKPSIIPLGLAVACALGYLATALALTVVLKILPGFEVLAYGLFVVLALTSAVNLTLRRDHVRRLQGKTKPTITRTGKSSESPAKPPASKPESSKTRPAAKKPGTFTGVSEETRVQARQILAERPDISGAELGRLLGRSDSLGRKLKRDLMGQGSGSGIEQDPAGEPELQPELELVFPRETLSTANGRVSDV